MVKCKRLAPPFEKWQRFVRRDHSSLAQAQREMFLSMTSKQYKKPPITEAVLDFRVKVPAGFEDLAAFADRVAGRYPTRQQLQNIEVKLDGEARQIGLKHTTQGFRLTSEDQADICIAGAEGLTTSRLAPYIGWDRLLDTWRQNWAAWTKATHSSVPKRIGLRYINRIDVPQPQGESVDFGEYVALQIRSPKVTDEPLLGYGMQLQFQSRRPKWNVSINCGKIANSPIINHISFLLDIDVYRDEDIPTAQKRLEEILEEAHGLKNELFEVMITDASRALFE